MDASPTRLPSVIMLQPVVLEDERGHFFEAFNQAEFAELTGVTTPFVQDNESQSRLGVLRGIHLQNPNPQGKLVRVIEGAVFDVAVDLRQSSATYLGWVGIELTAANRTQLWIPEGFGHAYLTLSQTARVLYKTTAPYDRASDHAVAWNDPAIGVTWPLDATPTLSPRDAAAPRVERADFLFP